MQWRKFFKPNEPGCPVDPGEDWTPPHSEDRLVEMDSTLDTKLNIGGIMTKMFIDSKITLLVMVAALAFGMMALFVTPREENPQISVPMVNVIVPFPGASPQEVENLISIPLERKLWDIKGVEHVYSTAFPDFGVVAAQFYVGEDQEDSVFKVYETVYSNLDQAPLGIMSPIVKPVDINDVPIVALTLFSEERSTFELRQEATALLNELREVAGTSESVIVGGDDRQITIEIDPVKSAAYAVDPMLIVEAIGGANFRLPTDRLENGGTRVMVRSGQFLRNAEDVGNIVVKTHTFPNGMGGEPIYLRDIATVTDGPAEMTNISRISFGQKIMTKFHGGLAADNQQLTGHRYNAVTLAVAKQKGKNAVTISQAVIDKMSEIAPTLLSDRTSWLVTRDDGASANKTVNELVYNLTWAIIIVIGLLVIFLGWRDAAVVAVAIPITVLVTLAIGYLAGQTINRITLFALILSLGILVDQAIVVVENIHRHLQLRQQKCSVTNSCILAVNEIANPTIYATLVVVVSMIPMAFVTGMMGPYMGPIPFNVPVAMIISLIVAFKISPYLALRWLKIKPAHEQAGGDKPATTGSAALDDAQGANPILLKLFNRVMVPLMDSPAKYKMLMIALVVALLICFAFPAVQWVKFRMLPKANVKTFLVTVDLPASAALNSTEKLARELEDRLLLEPEVVEVITTVGAGSVIDFNGLLRGTAFRNQPYQADLRVNLTPKEARSEKSEEMVRRIRPELHALAAPFNANVKLVEDPPGPPVRSTLVAEIYGPYGQLQRDLVAQVRQWFGETAQVTDIDDSVSTVAEELKITVDEEKAVQAGLKVSDVSMSLRAALSGYPVTQIHDPAELNQTPVVLRFPVEYRSSLEDLGHIVLPSPLGPVPLNTLVNVEHSEVGRPVYHKDLRPVSYVFGEMDQRSSVYANIDLITHAAQDPLPPSHELKWEGEWDLTLKVFRDLGIAMGVAILLIYLLLVGRFKSFSDPILLMGAVPLTMLGVLPGFAIVGAWDVYFSATGMIGVIALSGIVVRNSIILIEFIQDSMAAGMSLRDAVIYAGVIRTRPIFLTAVTAMAGMLMMVTDPVWSGLSWALLFGIAASTPLSLVVIPLLYYHAKRNKKQAEPQACEI
ncbi:efflux RND transporter permease subunit [bacterium]|nr:efflux RND transporter permease subunit [bacterium]